MIIFLQRPITFEKRNEIPQKSKDALVAVFRVLEGLLDNSKSKYFAGSNITIADISILASVTISIVSEITQIN